MKFQVKRLLMLGTVGVLGAGCQGAETSSKKSGGAGSGSGDMTSCMVSMPRGDAGKTFASMCFNFPEGVNQQAVCSEKGLTGRVTATPTDSQTPSTGSPSTDTEGETEASGIIPEDASEVPGLSLADSAKSTGLKFRLNGNNCDIIIPHEKACEIDLGGKKTSVFFSLMDVAENEIADLCANTIGGTEITVPTTGGFDDIAVDTEEMPADEVNTEDNINGDTDSTGTGVSDSADTTGEDSPDTSSSGETMSTGNTDSNTGTSNATGLAASLTSMIKDCGDSSVPSEYCGSGKVGNGPRFTLNNPGSDIQQGFVDAANNRLVIVTGPHLEESGILPDGQSFTTSIMAVDLSSGDRSVISGLSIDPANGNEIKGNGPVFGEFAQIKPSTDGKFYVKGPSGALMSVNPTDGSREIVKDFPDPKVTIPITPCARAFSSRVFTLDNKGNYFFSYKTPGGAGIIKWDSATDSCSYLTATKDPEVDNVGSGPALADNMVNMEYRDGFIYGNIFLGRHIAKVATEGDDAGRRSLISSVERDVGSGSRCHGVDSFAFTGTTFLQASIRGGSSAGCIHGPSIMRVTLDGERSAPQPGKGWENPPGEVKRVFAVPGSEDIYLGATEKEVVIIDWNKKKASKLSSAK